MTKLSFIEQSIYTANAVEVSAAEDTLVYGPTAVGTYVVLAVDNTPDTLTISLAGAPTSFSVAADGTDMDLTFSAPASSGNLPVLSYDARWSDDETDWTEVTGVTSGGSIPDLPETTLIYVQVAAVTAAGRGAWTASDSDTTGTGVSSGMVSDTFDTEINSSVWTYYGHANGSAAWASGGYAQLNTDNATRYGVEASRLEQVCANVDFQVAANFNTLLGNVAFQFQGFEVWQDANDWMQIYVERDASGFVAQRTESVAGTLADIGAVAVTQNDTAYMRLTRTGNDWTFETSPDGSAWTTRLTFTFALTVARVGLCTGTAGSGPAMATRVNSFTVS